MTSWKKAAAAMALILAVGPVGNALAAKAKKAAKPATGDDAKISTDPGSATVKENKVLKWGPVDPPSTGKNDEFQIRGVLVDIIPQKDADGKEIKGLYVLKFHIVEILENEERSITFDTFATGIDIRREVLIKDFWKKVKKGQTYDVRQWYEIVDEGGQGHAKMMGYIFHQDIVGSTTGPGEVLKTPGLYMEQYRNALVGLELLEDKGAGDPLLKDALDALASSASDPQVKQKATALLAQLYSAQPSGKAMLTPAGAPPAKGKKKG